MKTEWGKVTPLSKVLAMTFFVVLPFLGFYLGIQYEKLSIDIPSPDEKQSSQVISSVLTEEIAMKELFGSYNQSEHAARWHDTFATSSKYGTNQFMSKAISIVPWISENKLKYVGLFEVKELLQGEDAWDASFGCHFCSPDLMGVIFEFKNGEWNVQTVQKNIQIKDDRDEDLELGYWGNIFRPQIIEWGRGKIGFRFDTRLSAQGTTWGRIYVLGVFENGFRWVFSLPDAEASGDGREAEFGYLPPYHYKSHVKFKTAGDVYDIIVEKSGTKPIGNIVESVQEVKNYHFNGSIYELVEK